MKNLLKFLCFNKKEKTQDSENEVEVTVAECGHSINDLKGQITAFGEDAIFTLKVNEGKIEHCFDCLQKMAIQCPWCKGPIFIGDKISLRSPLQDDFEIPEHSVIYQREPLALVGCIRMNCALSAMGISGIWVPPGEVFRFKSPIEQIIQDRPLVYSDKDLPC